MDVDLQRVLSEGVEGRARRLQVRDARFDALRRSKSLVENSSRSDESRTWEEKRRVIGEIPAEKLCVLTIHVRNLA